MAEMSRKLTKMLSSGLPDESMLQKELERELKRSRLWNGLRVILFGLILLAAMAILVSVYVFPVVRIYGRSMEPTLQSSEIVLASRQEPPEPGDMVAFQYNNSLLVKRVIAHGGQVVDLKEDGSVTVNGRPVTEPYVKELAVGETDLEYPFLVPEGKYFVMGDARITSIDSRSTVVGCITEEQITGTIFFRVWPIKRFGLLE